MTFSKAIGFVLSYLFLSFAVTSLNISNEAAYIGVCIMLAGFMAGGKND